MLLAQKADLLTRLIAAYEAALGSAQLEDQIGLTARSDQADHLIASLLRVDQRLAPTRSTPEIDGLVQQAREMHRCVLTALHTNKNKVGEMLRDSNTFKHALKSYHSPSQKTGRRINVTDT